MQKIVHKLPLAAVIVSASLLAGCGGGGDGATSSSLPVGVPTAAEVVITSENQDQVASSAVQAVTSSQSATSITPFGVDINAVPESKMTIVDVIDAIAKVKLPTGLQDTPVGVSGTQTENCPNGGTVTASGTINENAGVYDTAGNNASIIFNNCVYSTAGYTSTYNGTISIAVTSANSTQRVFSLGMRNLSFTSGTNSAVSPYLDLVVTQTGGYDQYQWFNAAETNSTMTGNISYTSNGVNRSISANQLRETVRDGNHAENGSYQFQGYQTRYSINGLMSYAKNGAGIGAGNYTTITPFQTNSYGAYPSSGQAIFEGKSGKIRITAQSDATNVLVELDANGDNTYESSKTMTWAQLVAAL